MVKRERRGNLVTNHRIFHCTSCERSLYDPGVIYNLDGSEKVSDIEPISLNKKKNWEKLEELRKEGTILDCYHGSRVRDLLRAREQAQMSQNDPQTKTVPKRKPTPNLRSQAKPRHRSKGKQKTKPTSIAQVNQNGQVNANQNQPQANQNLPPQNGQVHANQNQPPANQNVHPRANQNREEDGNENAKKGVAVVVLHPVNDKPREMIHQNQARFIAKHNFQRYLETKGLQKHARNNWLDFSVV